MRSAAERKRKLPLISFVVEALREHRVEQLRYRSELEEHLPGQYQDHNLLYPGALEDTRDNLEGVYRKAMER